MALYNDKDGKLWFKENFYRGGLGAGFVVDKVLVERQSKYQYIQVFGNSVLVRVLVIDGIIQFSYFDESQYHGPMAGFSVGVHQNPRNVAIFGGGDLGILHKILLKYWNSRMKVTVVEIDEEVTKVCREFLPKICKKVPQKKSRNVQILFEDGSEFIQKTPERYDVVIVDSSENEGPNEPLFNSVFYQNIFERLNEDGILLVQAGSLSYSKQWLKTFRMLSSIQPSVTGVKVFRISVPTYGGDFILIGAIKGSRGFLNKEELIKRSCYWNKTKTEWNSPRILLAAITLPPQARKMLRNEIEIRLKRTARP